MGAPLHGFRLGGSDPLGSVSEWIPGTGVVIAVARAEVRWSGLNVPTLVFVLGWFAFVFVAFQRLGRLLFVGVLVVFMLSSPAHAGGSSYRTLRYTHVVGQTDWYTCGAAAVATLLSHYYADPTTEEEVLRVASLETQASGKDPMQGLTALSLKRYLEGKGYPVRAYRVTLEGLADYFARGGLPVVAHVTRPQLHFVVIVGLVEPSQRGGHVLLADPSWGRRILPLEALVTEKGFSGVILLAVARDGEQLGMVRQRQDEELAWAQAELRRLGRLRELLLRR